MRSPTELRLWLHVRTRQGSGGEKGFPHPAQPSGHGSREVSDARLSRRGHGESWMGLETPRNSLKMYSIKKVTFPSILQLKKKIKSHQKQQSLSARQASAEMGSITPHRRGSPCD